MNGVPEFHLHKCVVSVLGKTDKPFEVTVDREFAENNGDDG